MTTPGTLRERAGLLRSRLALVGEQQEGEPPEKTQRRAELEAELDEVEAAIEATRGPSRTPYREDD